MCSIPLGRITYWSTSKVITQTFPPMRGPNLQGWGEWSGDHCSAGICSYKGYRSSTRSLGLHLLFCPSWEATAWGQQPNQTCVWEDLSTGTPWAISGSESVLTAWLGDVWGDSHPPVFPKKVTRGLIWPVPCKHTHTHSHLHHFSTKHSHIKYFNIRNPKSKSSQWNFYDFPFSFEFESPEQM